MGNYFLMILYDWETNRKVQNQMSNLHAQPLDYPKAFTIINRFHSLLVYNPCMFG